MLSCQCTSIGPIYADKLAFCCTTTAKHKFTLLLTWQACNNSACALRTRDSMFSTMQADTHTQYRNAELQDRHSNAIILNTCQYSCKVVCTPELLRSRDGVPCGAALVRSKACPRVVLVVLTVCQTTSTCSCTHHSSMRLRLS